MVINGEMSRSCLYKHLLCKDQEIKVYWQVQRSDWSCDGSDCKMLPLFHRLKTYINRSDRMLSHRETPTIT